MQEFCSTVLILTIICNKRLAESPNCDRERNRRTVVHFLVEYKLYGAQRVKMVKPIAKMWFNKKTIGTFNLCKEILAGPTFSNKINVEDDKKIKQALFVFLQESKAI